MKKFTRKQLISFWIGLGLLVSGTLFLRNANGELVDLNITGGVSGNDNPAIFNNDVRISGNIELTAGGSITSTANGDITFAPNGTGDVNWNSQNSTMTTAGALTLSGQLTGGADIVAGGNFTAGVSGTVNFTGDTNTGMINSAADTLLFRVGGVDGLTINTSGATLTDNLTVGGAITVNGHTTIGNAVTDDINLRGLPRLPSDADPRANNIVPTYAAGTLIWNSTLLSVCVSSGTVATSWVRIEAPTTACQ